MRIRETTHIFGVYTMRIIYQLSSRRPNKHLENERGDLTKY